MKKIQKHIEIVRSTTVGLSSLSRASAATIDEVLRQHYALVGITIVNSIEDLELLAERQPDLVFMGMKYLPDDSQPDGKIWLSGYLEQRGIEHTGSPRQAIELERDKSLAKQRVLDAGLQTAPFMVIKKDDVCAGDILPLRFPLFAKPTDRGGGEGIDGRSIVRNPAELHAKCQSIAEKYAADTLVEEFLPGREFSVGILRDEHSKEWHVMPIELFAAANADGERLLSQRVKASNQEIVLPVNDSETKHAVTDLAIQVFQTLGARDYGRIDIRLNAAGRPHFLEANLIPSLINGYGSFPKACMLNLGLDHEAMVLSIVRLGLERLPGFAETKSPLALPALFRPLPAI